MKYLSHYKEGLEFVATKEIRKEIKNAHNRHKSIFINHNGLWIDKGGSHITFEIDNDNIIYHDDFQRLSYLFNSNTIKTGYKIKMWVEENGSGSTEEHGLKIYEMKIRIYNKDNKKVYSGLLRNVITTDGLSPFRK